MFALCLILVSKALDPICSIFYISLVAVSFSQETFILLCYLYS